MSKELALTLCIVFIALGAICVTLFVIGKVKKYSVKETIVKSVASLFFIAVAAVNLRYKGLHILPLFVVLGLICGLCGDIWLELKVVYKEQDTEFTYAGFVSFALGHVFYITGMYLEFFHEGDNVLFIILPLLVGLIAGFCNLFLAKLSKQDFGKYKAICVLYGSLLFSFFLVNISLNIMHGFQNTTLIILLVGSVLFVLSDLILSGTYFGEGKERPIDLISNSITYYTAQYVIAFSLFFI